MNIEHVEISIIDEYQTIITDDGFYRCSGCLIEDNRMIISNRDEFDIKNISDTINHEFLHIILDEIDGKNASFGLDTINEFYTYPISM